MISTGLNCADPLICGYFFNFKKFSWQFHSRCSRVNSAAGSLYLGHTSRTQGSCPAFPAHVSQFIEATGAARRTQPLELPGSVRLSQGNSDRLKVLVGALSFCNLPPPRCLVFLHPALTKVAAAAAILKFIGIITYEKSAPWEGGRGWRWVADCDLTIRLKYAKANK